MNQSSLMAPRIKEERLRLGLNQAEIAHETGVSREMWGKYERGQATPGGEVLFAFAAAGADIQYIMTGNRVSAPSLSPRASALLDNYQQLCDDDQRALERLASAIQKPTAGVKTG
ncbi:helix-turn-helix domain-containing protein [Marinimicrobium sp. ARAG 43.8]|uniref:helix-turn-helix domain-containing protein n=1 Tax=Marinimicrobium sp. ARAG 43.8 TaxID=3418719 RepID=UPI003CE85DC8